MEKVKSDLAEVKTTLGQLDRRVRRELRIMEGVRDSLQILVNASAVRHRTAPAASGDKGGRVPVRMLGWLTSGILTAMMSTISSILMDKSILTRHAILIILLMAVLMLSLTISQYFASGPGDSQ